MRMWRKRGGPVDKQHQTGLSGFGVAAVLASVALVHVAWWLLGDGVVVNGNLVDSDGYARLQSFQE